MPFNQADLDQTFDEAVSRFNSGDYDSLAQLFDQDIAWKMLHHVDSRHGRDNVKDWLKNNKSTLNPQFTPDTDPTKKKKRPNTGDSGVRICGPAKWKPAKIGSVVEELDYVFTFTRSGDGAPWFLINAFGNIVS